MAQADDLGLVVNDIVSLTKSGTGAPGTVDTYIFTLRDGKTFSFQVTNGANGSTGGVEKHEFTTVSDFTDWYLTIDLSMLISVAFFDADYNSMLCYIDNSGANTKLYKTLPNGVMQELSALSTGEKIVAFLKVDETLEFVPVTREIAGIGLGSNITENALFDKMNIKGVYATLSALQTANPSHNYCYLVKENNHWYYWNGNTWTDGGTFLNIFTFEGILATNTDLDSIAWTSTYMLLANYTYSNLPKSITLTYNWAILETLNTVGGNVIQSFTDTGDGAKYYRIRAGSNSNWTKWFFVGSKQNIRTVGSANVDINIDNIRDYGIYLMLNTAQGTLPETITTYGTLFVIYASGTSAQQIYSGNTGKLFIRYYNSGVWSEWTELYSNLFPADYKYPYIYNKGVRCNKANDTVTAYYAGVNCGEGVKVDVNSVRYCWAKAKSGQTSGVLALVMNPNGCDKISQIVNLSLHLILTATHLKVDILGERYGQYYYQNLINQDLINPQTLDGTTNHTVTLSVYSAQRVYVYIDGTDTYTGVFTPDANISSLYDVIGPYALFEHYCSGDMDNYAMPIFKQWLVRQGNDYYVYDNFDRENGQLQNTPQGLPYHLFSTSHNQG